MENLIADTYGHPPVAWTLLIYQLRLEDDEEEKEWEQEQIRRAGHRDHTPETLASAPQVYKPSPSTSDQARYTLCLLTCVVPVAIPIPTLEPVIARLSQTLSNLTTSHSSNVSAMTSAADELTRIEEKEKELREAIEKTEAQRSWFSAFQEFVEGVAHFLDEKVKYPVWFTERDIHAIPSSLHWRNWRKNIYLCLKKGSILLQGAEKRKMRMTYHCSWAIFPSRRL